MKLLEMSAAEYYADPCPRPSLSQSMAHTLISQSPIHAYRAHPKLGGIDRVTTRDMDNGSVIHDLLLNGGTLEGVEVLQYADYRTKAAQADRDDAQARGMIPILQHKLDELKAVADAIRPMVRITGQTEGVVLWAEHADDGTEVLCKARIDHWDAPLIEDLKSTNCAHPKSILRSIFEHGYDIQAAAYLSAIEKLFPDLAGRVKFRFTFFELTDPYLVTPVEPDGSVLAVGRSKWRRAVNLWAECLRTNEWPGYVKGTYRAAARPWDIRDELEHSQSSAELAAYLA